MRWAIIALVVSLTLLAGCKAGTITVYDGGSDASTDGGER